MSGVHYIYPVFNDQTNCTTGRVTQIQYCFKYTPQAAFNILLPVFTLTIIDNVTGREVSVNVSTSSYQLQVSNMSCRNDQGGIKYCCDIMSLHNQFLPFPMNNITIIISTSRSNATVLQLVKNTSIPFSYSMDLNGNIDQVQSLALLRFKCKFVLEYNNFRVRTILEILHQNIAEIIS